MLAEIFMSQLEAQLRSSKDPTSTSSDVRFAAIKPPLIPIKGGSILPVRRVVLPWLIQYSLRLILARLERAPVAQILAKA